MDSGNSSSMQSSSGGGGGGGGGDDQEYDSRSLFVHNSLFSEGDPFNWPVRSDPNPNHNFLSFTGNFAASASTAAQPPPPPQADPKPCGQQAVKPKNPKKRTRASRRTPTTVLTTDTTNFRAMVQEFTGIPDPPFSAASRRLDLLSTAGSSMRLAAAFRPFMNQTQPQTLYQPFMNQTQPPPPPPQNNPMNTLFANMDPNLLGPGSLSAGMDPLGLGFGSTPNNGSHNNY